MQQAAAPEGAAQAPWLLGMGEMPAELLGPAPALWDTGQSQGSAEEAKSAPRENQPRAQGQFYIGSIIIYYIVIIILLYITLNILYLQSLQNSEISCMGYKNKCTLLLNAYSWISTQLV